MTPASGDGGELPVRRGRVVAPAGDGAVGAQPARMLPAGGDGGELPAGRGRLPLVVVAPAGDGAVGAQPARMRLAGGDGGELPVGSGRLPLVVVAPAGGGAVGAQPARMTPASGDGGELPGGLGGGLGRCEGQRRAGEPAVDGGGGGEEAHAGQPPVAPGVAGLALLEAELDAAAVEFARHDPHLADRQVQRRAGEPAPGGGGGGEEADAWELAVAPGVVGLALLEAELDAVGFEFARHDPHRRAVAGGVVLLGGGGGGGHRGAAQDGEQGDDRRAGAAPVTAGAAARSGSVRRGGP